MWNIQTLIESDLRLFPAAGGDGAVGNRELRYIGDALSSYLALTASLLFRSQRQFLSPFVLHPCDEQLINYNRAVVYLFHFL